VNSKRYLLLALTFLAGIVFLGVYTLSLSAEELKEWQELEAVVNNVGGLKELDEVQINGSRQGRVLRIQLYKSRQKLTLQVEPGLTLHAGREGPDGLEDGYAIEIVRKNALGTMAVRITPGDPTTPSIELDQLHEASLRTSVGIGEPTPGRREAIRESFASLAKQTAALRDPDSGPAGAVLFDPQRVLDVRDALEALDDQWAKVDASLAEIEAEQGIGRFLLSADTLGAIDETIEAGRDVLGRMRSGLAAANSGEAGSGGWVGDPVRAVEVRQALGDWREVTATTRAKEGLLGRALDPELADELQDTVEPLRRAAAEGVEERGLLGVLSGEEIGEWTRSTSRNLPKALDRIRTQLADNPESAKALQDQAANIDDALVNFQRGMTYVKRGLLPNRTSFINSVFSVF